MDYTPILDQAMEVMKPVAHAGEGIAGKVAASALWEWLKERFKKRPAAAEAVVDVEKSPGQDTNWQVLRAQLAKAMAEDEGFRAELMARLKELPQQSGQTANVTGDNNKVAQLRGSGSTINIS